MPPSSDRRTEERHEPLPSLVALPRYIWSRLPRAGKVAVGSLPVVATALVLLLGPAIERSKEDRARSEAEREQRDRAARIAELRVEQRPRVGRSASIGTTSASASASERLAARASLVADVRQRVLGDARARVQAGALRGPIQRVDCEPFPRSSDGVGAHERLGPRRGRYACVAVTAAIRGGDTGEVGVIGHPYRFMVDFQTGRYALCKISGRPGEGLLERDIPVTVPRACGGR